MRSIDILTLDEVLEVVNTLRLRAKRSPNTRMNLAIFRLSCCCGLRRKEIGLLEMRDLTLTGSRPCIRIRPEATKGREGKRRGRTVPLWWDAGTLEDLRGWYDYRVNHYAPGDHEPYIVMLSANRAPTACPLATIATRWRTALRCLGHERRRQLHIHCGRHSFCSHALSSGRSLVEVRDAAGHSSVAITDVYLHSMPTTARDIFTARG